MVDFVKLQTDAGIRRTRSRGKSLSFDKDKVAERIKRFYETDMQDRSMFIEDRLQRQAKYRLWSERESLPWEDASDIPLPDLMTDSLRMQDTLYNAVIGFGKPVGAVPMRREDEEKVEGVDNLLHHQLFLDMDGEGLIGDMAETFINDGGFTVFIPWIREDKEFSDLRIMAPIPAEVTPDQYFQELLQIEFPDALSVEPMRKTGWSWRVRLRDERPINVEFYTMKDGKVEMVIERVVRVFDGPRPMAKDIDEVLHPWRAANLQPPGPSNPGGASHVILIDHPTLDEVVRLQKSGFYDLLTREDLDMLSVTAVDRSYDQMQAQRDDFQGTAEEREIPNVESHKKLTRLMCFDMYDIDGDGIDEDVIWWMIKETETICKVKRLTEMYPANPPRRPFAEATMIPVKGRRIGISYLEMGEGLHDASKELIDQTIDAGTIASSPFFFYKSTSLQKPEILTLAPGEGFPMADPTNDINFPNIQNSSQAFGLNMLTVLGQMRERLTMVGDLQAGKVPAGKSSALRTSGGIQQLISQAEARPERILRRFFLGMAEMYRQMHELNERFLPKDKQVKVSGTLDPGKDPYQNISDTSMIKGRFTFNFKANLFNMTKGNLQNALGSIMSVVVSPLALQAGITDPDKIYRLFRKYIESWGQNADEYLKAPTPQSGQQLIQAEEAIISIMNDTLPGGFPFEGFVAHLDKLTAFAQSNEFGLLTANQIQIFGQYYQQVASGAQQEMQQQQLLRSAAMFAQKQGDQGDSRETSETPNMDNAQLNENEFLDRTMES